MERKDPSLLCDWTCRECPGYPCAEVRRQRTAHLPVPEGEAIFSTLAEALALPVGRLPVHDHPCPTWRQDWRQGSSDEFMLMHEEDPARADLFGGQRAIAFKHRETRNYLWLLLRDGGPRVMIPRREDPFMRGGFGPRPAWLDRVAEVSP